MKKKDLSHHLRMGDYSVFRDGVWAEIIKEKLLLEVRSQVEMNKAKPEEQKSVAEWRKSRYLRNHLAYFDGKCFVYGFDMIGEWFDDVDLDDLADNSCDIIIDTSDPADPKEVEQRLIEEAKRRGFKKGKKVTCLYDDSIEVLYGYPEYRTATDGSEELWFYGFALVFKDGKWAEIIEEPLTLNGKEIIVDDLGFDIGGMWFTKNNFKTYLSQLEIIGVESVKFTGVYDEFKVPDLRELLTKIEKNESK